MGQLWGMVRRFIASRAISYSRQFPPSSIEIDDLIQEGFLSVCEALETYRADGGAFLGYLDYFLRKRWRALYGLIKPEPLNTARSLDEPIGSDGEIVLHELIPDERAVAAFIRKEDEMLSDQFRETLRKALAGIPGGEIIDRKYFREESGPQIAEALGISLEDVYRLEKQAINHLRRKPNIQRLRDYDFFHGAGFQMWKDTGMSIEERYLMRY